MRRRESQRRRMASMRKGERSEIDEEPCRMKKYEAPRTIASTIVIRRKPIGT
jgi:hypothetical protein